MQNYENVCVSHNNDKERRQVGYGARELSFGEVSVSVPQRRQSWWDNGWVESGASYVSGQRCGGMRHKGHNTKPQQKNWGQVVKKEAFRPSRDPKDQNLTSDFTV
jgi:hypothetical protein